MRSSSALRTRRKEVHCALKIQDGSSCLISASVVGSENIPTWLPDHVTPNVAKEWDSYGIELNSPVYITGDAPIAFGHFNVSATDLANQASAIGVATALGDGLTKHHLSRIFNCPANDNDPYSVFDERSGNRNRKLNFTRLQDGLSYPSTIGFRQAKGQLNAEDITQWVDFRVWLLRLAYIYQAGPERFRVRHWRDYWGENMVFRRAGISVYDLMTDMGCDEKNFRFRGRCAY